MTVATAPARGPVLGSAVRPHALPVAAAPVRDLGPAFHRLWGAALTRDPVLRSAVRPHALPVAAAPVRDLGPAFHRLRGVSAGADLSDGFAFAAAPLLAASPRQGPVLSPVVPLHTFPVAAQDLP